VIGLFLLATDVPWGWALRACTFDAGFTTQLPLKHPYMATFLKPPAGVRRGERVLVALIARDGNMSPSSSRRSKGPPTRCFFLRAAIGAA